MQAPILLPVVSPWPPGAKAACRFFIGALAFTLMAQADGADRWDSDALDFRLLLGSLDGAENPGLGNDSARYAVGLAAFSPIAWKGVLSANLELWLNERGYRGDFATASGGTMEQAATLRAAALVYGVRLQNTRGALQPYAMAGFGFQATRLHTSANATGAELNEEIITPAAHAGFGLEWRSGNDVFGLDYRRMFSTGDLHEFRIDNAELGGEYLGLSLGTRW